MIYFILIICVCVAIGMIWSSQFGDERHDDRITGLQNLNKMEKYGK
jgi:hypothetical protein